MEASQGHQDDTGQAQQVADQAREKVGEAADQAKETAQNVAAQAQNKAREQVDQRTTEAGERIGSSVDSATGIPVISLFGDRAVFTPATFRDIDVLVYDIQDVGTRYYTFISSMQYFMEAALENNIPLVENPPLAQALYNSVDVGKEIPAHLYRAVAEVLAYIYRLTRSRRAGRCRSARRRRPRDARS